MRHESGHRRSVIGLLGERRSAYIGYRDRDGTDCHHDGTAFSFIKGHRGGNQRGSLPSSAGKRAALTFSKKIGDGLCAHSIIDRWLSFDIRGSCRRIRFRCIQSTLLQPFAEKPGLGSQYGTPYRHLVLWRTLRCGGQAALATRGIFGGDTFRLSNGFRRRSLCPRVVSPPRMCRQNDPSKNAQTLSIGFRKRTSRNHRNRRRDFGNLSQHPFGLVPTTHG